MEVVSLALSAVEDLLRLEPGVNASRLKTIDVIWAVQELASLVPFISLISVLLQNAYAREASGGTKLTISVYCIRATEGIIKITKDYTIPGLSLIPGRPKIAKVVDSVISQTLTLNSAEYASMNMEQNAGRQGMS